MNFRPTAQLRQWHDDGTCSDLCPHCARIDAYEHERRFAVDDRDFQIMNDPEGFREP